MNNSHHNIYALLVDRITLASGGLLIVVGLLFFKFNPFFLNPLRDLRPIAKIEGLEFESKRKIPGTLNWIDTETAATLYHGDQILTKSRSTAMVRFDSGAELFIGPQSLVKIELLDDEYQLILVKGQLKLEGETSIKVIHAESGQGLLLKNAQEITSSPMGLISSEDRDNLLNPPLQGSVIEPESVRSIDFSLKNNQHATATLYDANGNKVAERPVSGAFSFTTPKPGRYTVILTTGASSEVTGRTAFLVRPYKAPQLAPISTDKTYLRGETLPLKWNGIPEAHYRIDYKTSEGKKVALTQGNHYALPISAAGAYALQVTLIDNEDQYPGHVSEFNFKVQDGLLLDDKQLTQLVPEKTPASFEIKNNIRNAAIIYEVSPQKDFSENVKVFSSHRGKKSIPMNEPGVYFVRAKTKNAPPLVSLPAKVVVTTPVAAVAKTHASTQSISPRGTTARISWNKNKIADEVRLQVAQDQEFTKIIVDKMTDKKSETVELPQIGEYFWRLLPEEDAPEFLTPTEINPLMITLPPLRRPRVIAQQILEYQEGEDVPLHLIKLLPQDNVKTYTLEVYQDSALKKKVFTVSTTAPLYRWASNRSGKYYYRVIVTDIWGQTSPYSQPGELIFPISPMVEVNE
ncbi:MAG: hypothetical protein NDI69_14055 [Bacteriovoracaceae bacterium]|nr:hypothetical protein [Bacteriovoracaceae bacterium]